MVLNFGYDQKNKIAKLVSSEGWLDNEELSHSQWLGHLFKMLNGRLPGEVFPACSTEPGLQTPWGPTRWAGGEDWGKGCLGISAETVAQASLLQISGRWCLDFASK